MNQAFNNGNGSPIKHDDQQTEYDTGKDDNRDVLKGTRMEIDEMKADFTTAMVGNTNSSLLNSTFSGQKNAIVFLFFTIVIILGGSKFGTGLLAVNISKEIKTGGGGIIINVHLLIQPASKDFAEADKRQLSVSAAPIGLLNMNEHAIVDDLDSYLSVIPIETVDQVSGPDTKVAPNFGGGSICGGDKNLSDHDLKLLEQGPGCINSTRLDTIYSYYSVASATARRSRVSMFENEELLTSLSYNKADILVRFKGSRIFKTVQGVIEYYSLVNGELNGGDINYDFIEVLSIECESENSAFVTANITTDTAVYGERVSTSKDRFVFGANSSLVAEVDTNVPTIVNDELLAAVP